MLKKSVKKRHTKVIVVIGGGPAGVASAYALSTALGKDKGQYCVRVIALQLMQKDISSCDRFSLIEDFSQQEAILPSSFIQQPFNDAESDLIHWQQQQTLMASDVEFCVGWRLKRLKQHNQKVKLILTDDNNANRTLNADFVIDASGKSSKVANQFSVRKNLMDDAVYLHAYIDNTELIDVAAQGVVEAVEPGWWYVAQAPHNKLLVSLCTEKKYINEHHYHQPKRWLDSLRKTAWVSQKVPKNLLMADAQSIDLQICQEPASLLSQLYGAQWLAVGDAACCYDPISSSGLSKALSHGQSAGRAVASLLIKNDVSAIEHYSRLVLDDFNSHIGLPPKSTFIGNQFEQAQFWYRRFSSAMM